MGTRRGVACELHAYSADSEFTIFSEDALPLVVGKESLPPSFNNLLL